MAERLVVLRTHPAAATARAVAALALFFHVATACPAHAAGAPVASREHARAMALGHRALDAFLRREFAAAAALYHTAQELEPQVGEFAFGAARAEQEAGDLDAAADDFARALAVTPVGHPLHARAQAALRALQPPPPVAPPPPSPVGAPVTLPAAPTAASVVVHATAPSPAAAVASPPAISAPIATEMRVKSANWQDAAGWTALAVGVAAAAVAVGLAVSADGAHGALDAHKLPDGRYDLAQIAMNDAVNAQRAINTRWGWSGALGGVGVASLVAAGWWLLRSPVRHTSDGSGSPIAVNF